MKARPEMGNGKWEMGNGRTRMENGKPEMTKGKRGGFTFIDAVIVVVTVLLVVTVFLPWLARPRRGGGRIHCVSCLKQVGLTFRVWANDNDGAYPMMVSTNKGGSMEYNETGQVFRHFEAMREEMTTPKVLICPEDRRRTKALNWPSFINNSNVSYFVGLEANETNPQAILSGDRSITGGVRLTNRIMLLLRNSKAGWMPIIHTNLGNICLADGSVQQLTAEGLQKQLQAEFQSVTNEVIRLAIP